ncbi:hypothetical protein [Sphingobacterium siyangense]
MNNIHIAEIGELFNLEEGFGFLSNQNMLEYDFIVIDMVSLIQSIDDQLLSKITNRFNDLKEYISNKNIPVVFFCTGTASFSQKLPGPHKYIYEILGIDVEEVDSRGKKIDCRNDTLFTNWLKNNIEKFDYTLCFSQFPGMSIGNAKSKPHSIGFYTKDFIFLPSLSEDADYYYDEFLSELYAICKSVRKGDEQILLPEWSKNYLLPGEQQDREKLIQIDRELERLTIERKAVESCLETFLPLKQLWSGSGTTLENAARKVFEELGFTFLQTEANRDDIIMQLGKQIVIVEVKGLNKSAAEKNAAQLEKWVSTYMSEKGTIPKGILLINTFKDLPIADRTQTSFPHQMLSYSTNRNHCLITTVQLCSLLLYCRENPTNKNKEIKRLLNTSGVYTSFDKWEDFIEFDTNRSSL